MKNKAPMRALRVALELGGLCPFFSKQDDQMEVAKTILETDCEKKTVFEREHRIAAINLIRQKLAVEKGRCSPVKCSIVKNNSAVETKSFQNR